MVGSRLKLLFFDRGVLDTKKIRVENFVLLQSMRELYIFNDVYFAIAIEKIPYDYIVYFPTAWTVAEITSCVLSE